MAKYTIEELEEMVKSTDAYTRTEVAKQGYKLNKLINDNSWIVRREVAKHGYKLNKLINDKNKYVRKEVAKHGYGLDILVNDELWLVRLEVAKHGFGLDVLVNDKDEDVRLKVVKQGYGLDILVNDKNKYIRDIAKKLIKFNTHKVIAHNFGTYNGNLHLHYNNENEYLIISGCYESNNINHWKVKCEEQLDTETAKKYSELILKELNNKLN